MLVIVPKPSVVIKFPRPDTDDREYRSEDGTCFKVKSRKVQCSSGAVLPQPVYDADESRETGLTFRSPFQSLPKFKL